MEHRDDHKIAEVLGTYEDELDDTDDRSELEQLLFALGMCAELSDTGELTDPFVRQLSSEPEYSACNLRYRSDTNRRKLLSAFPALRGLIERIDALHQGILWAALAPCQNELQRWALYQLALYRVDLLVPRPTGGRQPLSLLAEALNVTATERDLLTRLAGQAWWPERDVAPARVGDRLFGPCDVEQGRHEVGEHDE